MRSTARSLVVTALLSSSLLGVGCAHRPVPDAPPPPPPMPTASGAGVEVKVLTTAVLESKQTFLVEEGSFDPAETALVAVWVRHGTTHFLVDAGLGKAHDAHFALQPWQLQTFSTLKMQQPLGALLQANGVNANTLAGVLLTHAHWDHTSGLGDLDNVQVFLHPAERLTVSPHSDSTNILADVVKPEQMQDVVFDDGPLLGFARSADFFKDGSVVAVEMPGHTLGSLGVFLRLQDGRAALLIGDTSWTLEGVCRPAHKPEMARIADTDLHRVDVALAQLHQLAKAHDDLLVVPAHDARALAALQSGKWTSTCALLDAE
mgnify:FL=1